MFTQNIYGDFLYNPLFFLIQNETYYDDSCQKRHKRLAYEAENR
jgi:hypothetical protein